VASDKKKKRLRPRGPLAIRHSSLTTAREVLRAEAAAVSALVGRIGEDFDRAVSLIAGTKGRVIVTGMGKSGLVARKIAATCSSIGTPAYFLHPAEAVHGDLGMLVAGDTLLALSYSGETEEILRLLGRVKHLHLPLISMSGNIRSTLARASDVALDIRIDKEACALNLAPTASTAASLALGDALAVAVGERKGFREDDFAQLHPGGQLGKRVRRVEQLMHSGDAMPVVRPQTPMRKVIQEMTRRGFGMTSVADRSGALLGVITDGDLRRWFQRNGDNWSRKTARECMSANPTTIHRREYATRALKLMESLKITALPVVDEQGRLEGLLHMHDLWS
jgi:arabinose-5-phosphate isomerase